MGRINSANLGMFSIVHALVSESIIRVPFFLFVGPLVLVIFAVFLDDIL